VLPEAYSAGPTVHLGTIFEVDIRALRAASDPTNAHDLEGNVNGGVAVAVYAPPKALEPRLPMQDVYEIRIYDSRRNRRLVAVIEIVSPSNKDCPQTRASNVAKIADLLKQGVCVSLIDVVTTSYFNLYAELLEFLEIADPALGNEPPPISAATVRLRLDGNRRLLDSWYHPLALGRSLPTIPIWLTETRAIPLDLESSYEETCRTLRIR
jgi:hypothetical protein